MESETVIEVSPKLATITSVVEESPSKRTPSKRKSAMDRHRQESEELLKNMGANPDELDGKRRTRSSAVKSTPPAASPVKKSPHAVATPTSSRRGRKKKADADVEEEEKTDTPKKSPPNKKQKLEDKLDEVLEKPAEKKEVTVEKSEKPIVVKENDVEMKSVKEVAPSAEIIESKKDDKIEETLKNMEVDSETKPSEQDVVKVTESVPEVIKTPESVSEDIKAPESVPEDIKAPESVPETIIINKTEEPAVVTNENHVKPSEAVIENSTNEISEVEKTAAVTPVQEAKIESTDEPKLAIATDIDSTEVAQ